MQKLDISFDTCYGIDKLIHTFEFTDNKVVGIYAKNGMMKTSFTKTMEKIQQGHPEEIRDEIFELPGTATVLEDNLPINSDIIFVIHSFENTYEADITPLLIDKGLKQKLEEVLNLRSKLFKSLEKQSGLKVKKINSGKTIYELETRMIEDFNLKENSFLVNLSQFSGEVPDDLKDCHIAYSSIFDEGVLKKIVTDEFQNRIENYLKAEEEIYTTYRFLSKGNLTLPKMKDLRKNLEKNSFFCNGNQIILHGEKSNFANIHEVDTLIKSIDDSIKALPEVKLIEKLLNDVKGRELKDVIETKPQILPWLKIEHLNELRKILWYKYISNEKDLFDELKQKYSSLEESIDSVNVNNTLWKEALDIYKKRFTVPYEMEITNLKGAIIGESVPRISFSFEKNGKKVLLSKDQLDEINVLSQGEKRALYLLNIIFDVEQRKRTGKETLFIVDDVADSFDYKNKYAIVEYLKDLTLEPNFSMIILTHNFDFYRTLTSRLSIDSNCCFTVEKEASGLTLVPETYHNEPFKAWLKNPDYKKMIAMIPLARNLVDFGREQKVNPSGLNDKRVLTGLLHEKEEVKNFTFENLATIYEAYLNFDKTKLSPCIIPKDKVLEKIEDISDSIGEYDNKLEDKLVLSISIRHLAEKYMIKVIINYDGTICWRRKKKTNEGTSTEYLKFVSQAPNQTNALLQGFRQIKEKIGIDNSIDQLLGEVNLMTPENIHLNSFMYEPILDMDINELLRLYKELKGL